jgi:CHAT domain-containing protein/Tfp pilus assembly protein PilF
MHAALSLVKETRSGSPSRSARVAAIAFLLVSLGLPRPGCSQETRGNVQSPAASAPTDQNKREAERARSWFDAGERAWERSDPRTAIENYALALAALQRLHDRSSEATTLNHLGLAYRELSQYAKAIDFYEQALAIEREVGDRKGEGITLNNLGWVYDDLSQPAEAIRFYEEALPIRREIGDCQGEGATLNNLGAAYCLLSQYAKAIDFYERALAIEREVGDRMGEGITLHNLGAAYCLLSQYAKAIDSYEQALAIDREVGDRGHEGITLDSLGWAYYFLSQYGKAIGFYEQALAIEREVGNRAVEASILMGLGDVYLSKGQYAEAIGFCEPALAIERAIGDRLGEASTLNVLGIAYRYLSEYAKAIAFYEQALTITREVGERLGEASTLNNLGKVHDAVSEYAKAIAFYEQALVITREVGNRAGEAVTLDNLMLTLGSQQRLRLAVLFGKQAVNAYQQIRQGLSGLDKNTRKAYVGAHEDTYRMLADLLLAQDRIAEAQQVLNLLKEEEFFDFVRRDSGQASSLAGRADLNATEADWNRRYNEIAGRLTELGHERGELFALQTRTAEQEARLKSLDSDLTIAGEAFQKFLTRLDAEAAQQKLSKEKLDQVETSQALMETLRELGSGTVAIYTLVTEDRLRLILITPNVMKTAEVAIKRTDLNAKIVAFRQSLENPLSDPRPMARELYKLIVGPIEKDLAGAKAGTLMWSLDLALRYLPVAALHDGDHYLVETFRNVVFTPASNANLKDVPAVEWRALGLGVSKAHEGFGALPGAKKELEGIIHDEATGTQGVMPGAVELDEAFTEQSMLTALRQHYRVVHIASHFRFKPGNETDSYLLLGDGGHMSLADMGKMVNPFGGVELLTLSACDTASGGTGANGKEVEGFGVLAQKKGAKAVIATLWPVADASTNELMQTFYRIRESKQGTTKAEALRQAQLALLRGTNYSHPYYWAPFILIGNAR